MHDDDDNDDFIVVNILVMDEQLEIGVSSCSTSV
jgi:hypothetical protein